MLFSLLLLVPIASAHFLIDYPGTRGFDEDTQGNWPCGGFDEVSSNRSEFPLNGGPIQIHSTHTQQLYEILVAVGNDPGENFNHIVVPTLLENGPGNFCFGDVELPSALNATEGMNATFQIISGTSHGGLYGCVDVTFTSRTLSDNEYSQHCTNVTAMQVYELKDSSIHANESSPSDVETVSSSSTGDTENIGVRLEINGWFVLAMGLVLVKYVS